MAIFIIFNPNHQTMELQELCWNKEPLKLENIQLLNPDLSPENNGMFTFSIKFFLASLVIDLHDLIVKKNKYMKRIPLFLT